MNRIISLLMCILLFTACEKGAEGPMGPEGPAGVQGVAGADGTLIHSGSAVPADNIGAVGDFYLRTSTSVLYGPKSADGWGTGVSLKGSTGSAGTPGSKMLSGTAVPTTQGAIGDFYFRTTTGVLYGPKTSSGWGSGVSLKGPKGDKGEPGNANVKVYEFGSKSFTQSLTIGLPIAYATAEKGAVLAYYQVNSGTTGWIQAPGVGPRTGTAYAPLYYVKMALRQARPSTTAELGFYLYLSDTNRPYTTQETWEKIKIVFIEASEVIQMSIRGVDLSDYEQVKMALNLE